MPNVKVQIPNEIQIPNVKVMFDIQILALIGHLKFDIGH